MKPASGFDPANTVGVALHKSSYLFKTALRSVFVENGLDATPEEFITLVFIPPEGTDQADLLHKLQKEKTNVTRLLVRMEKKQWITRESHPTNGRQQCVYISPLGIEMRQQLLPLVQRVAKKALNGIEKADVDTTQQTLEKMAKNLRLD